MNSMVFGEGVSSMYGAIMDGFSIEYDQQYGKPQKGDDVAIERKANVVYGFSQEVKFLSRDEFNEYFELYSTTYDIKAQHAKKRGRFAK